MAYVAAQFALFEEPDDYVLENNPDVSYDKVLDKFDFNLFQDEEQLYYKSLSDFNRKLVKKTKEKKIQQHVELKTRLIRNCYGKSLRENRLTKPSFLNSLQ